MFAYFPCFIFWNSYSILVGLANVFYLIDTDIMPASKKTTTKSVKKTTKSVSNPAETSVSVITKTSAPKVVVHREKVESNDCCVWKKCESWFCPHRFIKFLCMIVMVMIILFTFFLSVKTYRIANETHEMLSELSALFMAP